MQDVDKLEAGIDAIQKVVAVGEKVFKDGKIDMKDIVLLPEMYEAIASSVKAFKEAKEMYEEAKDIDSVEAVKLISKLFK